MSCDIVRAFVIGPGEVGRRLEAALDRAGLAVKSIGRHDDLAPALDPARPALRLLAVREEDLGPLLGRFPGALRERLVLVQNGFLEAVHGDLGPVTRGLIWFTSKGPFFRELGPSLFHGPAAGPLVEQLARGGLAVREIHGRPEFLHEMILKGLWNTVVGLPLAVHGEDLATYLAGRETEWRTLLDEGAAVASAAYGAAVTGAEAAERLLRTTGALGHVRGGTKALPWRNGAIARLGRALGIPTPLTDELLSKV